MKSFMSEWFYALDGRQQGPVSTEQLKHLRAQNVILGSSLVWSNGMPQWAPFDSVLPRLTGTAASDSVWQTQASVAQQTEPLRHSFVFKGTTGEFFRIWIVNVVLTVLTLGIYAAWAKVRTRRYFYGNLHLDGKPFDFTGNPIAILKGDLIFGSLFLIYVVAGSVFPPLALAVILFIALLAPWLIQKALRFRAQNTVYRNVRMRFLGTAKESYVVFMGLLLLIPFTLGFIVPYLQYRQKRYFLGHLAWGSCEAKMEGRAGFFYKLFLKCLGLVLLVAVIGSFVLAGLGVSKMGSAQPASAHSDLTVENHPGSPMEEKTELDRQIERGIEDVLNQNANLSEEEKEQIREKAKASAQGIMSMFLPAIIVIYGFGIIMMLFYQVRTSNYCINTTQWGQLGKLESTVRLRDLLWLYLTNGIAVLLSVGLLIPWVQVRMARYRADHTALITTASLDEVSQAVASEELALGDAGADIFDFEIGF